MAELIRQILPDLGWGAGSMVGCTGQCSVEELLRLMLLAPGWIAGPLVGWSAGLGSVEGLLRRILQTSGGTAGRVP